MISNSRIRVIKALGAKIISTSSFLKGNRKELPEAILVDGIAFPPHSTAVHSRITKVINNAKERMPIIDLVWVVQSIIQRKRLSFDDDKRYRVSTGNHCVDSNVSLLKVKSKEKVFVRYEVGDTVSICQKGAKQVAYARIVRIRVERRKRNTLDVQLLVSDSICDLSQSSFYVSNFVEPVPLKHHNESLQEPHGDFELMDVGCSTAAVTIDETQLSSHIILLSTKDFRSIHRGYILHEKSDSDIFMQKKRK